MDYEKRKKKYIIAAVVIVGLALLGIIIWLIVKYTRKGNSGGGESPCNNSNACSPTQNCNRVPSSKSGFTCSPTSKKDNCSGVVCNSGEQCDSSSGRCVPGEKEPLFGYWIYQYGAACTLANNELACDGCLPDWPTCDPGVTLKDIMTYINDNLSDKFVGSIKPSDYGNSAFYLGNGTYQDHDEGGVLENTDWRQRDCTKPSDKQCQGDNTTISCMFGKWCVDKVVCSESSWALPNSRRCSPSSASSGSRSTRRCARAA